MSIGHIHGRFQPFHEGHVDYLEWAVEECDRVLVGITNADSAHTTQEEADPERHKKENNPYKYYERQCMIQSFIDSRGWENHVHIAPFPINLPELWDYYAPADSIHFVKVLEQWQREKAQRIRNNGREVRTQETNREISGTEIRKRMRNGQSWRSQVPDPVVKTIEAHNLELPQEG